MAKCYIRVKAPFAAFRGFEAGYYRSTAPTIPYTTAQGLILNIAGIDSRVNKSLPNIKIAIGVYKEAQYGSSLQHMHVEMVGTGDKESKPKKGFSQKTDIRPVVQEFLIGLDILLAIETDDDTLTTIRKGLVGSLEGIYGVLFFGENDFTLELIEEVDSCNGVRWYSPVKRGSRHICFRSTTYIDREDSTKTRFILIALEQENKEEPPEDAWVPMGNQAPVL